MPGTPPNSINPFIMVHTELWNMLLAHPGFVRDVKEGNRIRFDSDTNRDPLKNVVQVADTPSVMIVGNTVSFNLMETSSTSLVKRQYAVMIATGDMRNNILAVVEWEVFCALLSWKTRLSALQWKKKAFAKVMRAVSGASRLDDLKQNMNLKGWSAVWQVEVEMHFVTSDLEAELVPDATTPGN